MRSLQPGPASYGRRCRHPSSAFPSAHRASKPAGHPRPGNEHRRQAVSTFPAVSVPCEGKNPDPHVPVPSLDTTNHRRTSSAAAPLPNVAGPDPGPPRGGWHPILRLSTPAGPPGRPRRTQPSSTSPNLNRYRGIGWIRSRDPRRESRPEGRKPRLPPGPKAVWGAALRPEGPTAAPRIATETLSRTRSILRTSNETFNKNQINS